MHSLVYIQFSDDRQPLLWNRLFDQTRENENFVYSHEAELLRSRVARATPSPANPCSLDLMFDLESPIRTTLSGKEGFQTLVETEDKLSWLKSYFPGAVKIGVFQESRIIPFPHRRAA